MGNDNSKPNYQHEQCVDVSNQLLRMNEILTQALLQSGWRQVDDHPIKGGSTVRHITGTGITGFGKAELFDCSAADTAKHGGLYQELDVSKGPIELCNRESLTEPLKPVDECRAEMSPHERAVIDEINARTDKLLAEADGIRLLNERMRKEDNPVEIAST